MRIATWNVNGLRACLRKGFMDGFNRLAPDILCLQETKAEQGQAELDLAGYDEYWNSAEKKGYSGTAVFTRIAPLSVRYGIGKPEHDNEGRVIALEFADYFLVNVYTPNARRELERLPYRMVWEDAFRNYLQQLDAKKPVVLCGDLNVAHTEMDIKNPKSNLHTAGFTAEERQKMTELLAAGFCDVFRRLNPDARDAYTWWAYWPGARERNVGWRIDYFLCSERLLPRVTSATIHPDILGSDHCPVGLTIE